MRIRGKRRYVAAVSIAMVSPGVAGQAQANSRPASEAVLGVSGVAASASTVTASTPVVTKKDEPNKQEDDKEQRTNPLKYGFNVSDGGEYGVGMPIIITFRKDIPEGYRPGLMSRVSLESDPWVRGAWQWTSARELTFRPMTNWLPGTQVTVHADLDGLVLQDSKTLTGDTQRSFTIGDDVRIKIDNSELVARFYRNGQEEKRIPVSMGREHSKPEFITRSGVKVIMTQERHRVLRGPADDPYEVPVEYAQRLTNSGEFIHSAPWSVGAQGRTNVSHGCTNVSTDNAKWLYDNAKIGDIVEVTGTTRPMDENNGYGSVWLDDWEEWSTDDAQSPGAFAPRVDLSVFEY